MDKKNNEVSQNGLNTNNGYLNQNNFNTSNNFVNGQSQTVSSTSNDLYNSQQINSDVNQQFQNNQNNNMQNIQNNNYSNSVNQFPKRKETLGTVSLVLGIISFLLSYFLNILVLPLAIIGLILGIVNKVKNGTKIAGIILNSIAIAIVVIMVIIAVVVLRSDGFSQFFSTLYNELDYSTSQNYVAGQYNCTGVDSKTDKYLITLHLNNDNTFLYGPYGDLDNNYAKGTYTYEDEHKTNNNGEYKYFMVSMVAEKENFIINGLESDHEFNSKMEIGLTNHEGSKQGIVMFVNSYNMYYCYEQ